MRKLFQLVALSFLLTAPAQAADADKILDIQEIKTDAGLSVWLVEDHTIPVITLHFAFENAGSAGESAENQGLARLASNTMDEGAGDLDSDAFQEELRRKVITLRFGSDRDMFGGVVQTRTETSERAFELLRLAINEPRFDEAPVERMKAANLSRIKSGLSNPNWVLARLVNDKVFEGHPYALNSGGTLSTLPSITAEDLREFADTRLGQDNLNVAIVGDITPERAKEVVDGIFSSLPKEAKVPEVEDFQPQNPGMTAMFNVAIPQTVIQAVQPALPRDSEDYYAYTVMNYVLGAGGFGSRLTKEIREARGLTYGIYTYPQYMKHTNIFTLSVATANESAGEVLDLARAEMERIREQPITQKELEETVSYLIGSFPLTLSSTGSIAELLLSMQLDDLSADYINERRAGFKAVTIEDVQRAAQEYLHPDQMTVIMVGQPQGLDLNNVTQLKELPNVE